MGRKSTHIKKKDESTRIGTLAQLVHRCEIKRDEYVEANKLRKARLRPSDSLTDTYTYTGTVR